MRAVILIAIAAFLSGCVTKPLVDVKTPLVNIGTAPAAPIVSTTTQCVILHDFTPDQESAIAKALRNPPADPIWIVIAHDDEQMRAQARACIAANVTK